MHENATYEGSSQTKAGMRKRVLACRDSIPVAVRARRSAALCDRLAERYDAALKPGSVVAAYTALGSEPNLKLFLLKAYERQCRVCLPCMVRASKEVCMVFVEVDRVTFEAFKQPFLTRPAVCLPDEDPLFLSFRTVKPKEIDVIAVPLVAFDVKHNRMGYGGGNYDRFLESLRDDALVFGVGFVEQMVDAVIVEPHDKPLPLIEVA